MINAEDARTCVALLANMQPACECKNSVLDYEDGLVFLTCPDCGFHSVMGAKTYLELSAGGSSPMVAEP